MIWQFKENKIRICYGIALALLLILTYGCNYSEIKRPWIRRSIPFPQQNAVCKNDPNSAIRQIFTFQTDSAVRSFIEYREPGNKKSIFHSDTSDFTTSHRIVLWGLKPECEYLFRIVNTNNKTFSESEEIPFKTKFFVDANFI